MRLNCVYCLLLLVLPVVHAQPVKSKPRLDSCEVLCAELFASIRGNPSSMEMRLEEALVINESCAAEIVTVAIDAVNSEPAMVRKIVATALEMAPRRTHAITAAVQGYRTPEVAIAIPAGPAVTPAPIVAASEEIRRAELPQVIRPKPEAGEEVRRAELPLSQHNMPIVEVRRAVSAEAIPRAEPMQMQQPEPGHQYMNVPKAKAMRKR